MTGRVDDTYPYLSVQVNHVIGLLSVFPSCAHHAYCVLLLTYFTQ